MPCDTISTVKLRLKPEIVRMEWLKAAIESTGNAVTVDENRLVWKTGSYDRKTGQIVERSVQAANKIRQTYAAELTRRTLGRAGWQVRTVKQGGQ